MLLPRKWSIILVWAAICTYMSKTKTYFAWVLSDSVSTFWFSMHQITAFTSPPFSWRFGFILERKCFVLYLEIPQNVSKSCSIRLLRVIPTWRISKIQKKLHEESNIWIKYLGVCSWPGLSMYISPVSLSSTSCSFWVQGLALVSSPSGQSVDLVMMLTVVDFPVLVDPTIITQAFGLIFGFSFSGFSFLCLIESPILAWICSVPLSPKTSELGRLETCTSPAPKHVSEKTTFSPYVPVQFGFCLHSWLFSELFIGSLLSCWESHIPPYSPLITDLFYSSLWSWAHKKPKQHIILFADLQWVWLTRIMWSFLLIYSEFQETRWSHTS